jgi:putative ABC transport system permease protein
VLTLLSISIGVFAIIGVGTLVSSIDNAVSGELSSLGESTFIIKRMPSIQMGDTWRKYRKRKAISYSVYKEFRKQMTEGRVFSADDISFNRNVAIVGNDVVVKIFPYINPIGKKIAIKNQSFTIIGVLEIKGAVLGQSQDNQVIVPISQFLKYNADWWEESVTISVKAMSKEQLEATVDEAIGAMRTIRKVKPWEENSFEIETNESISEQFGSFIGFLSIFGSICGGFALIAAGVGIMNIMLVSVKERTREIGIRKAIGAKRRWVLTQFIIETITLCQLGGLIGIILGVIAGNVLGKMLGMSIVFPVTWIVLSIVICTLLGIFFGAYPAWKAAKLDPIDALRYE